MADNVAITAGSGTNIATDEVTGTGEHVQVVKLAISTDGSRTAIPADGTNGLKVEPSGAALTALQLIDDAIVADDAAFTPATTKVMMAGATVDDTSTDLADEGDAVAVRATVDRRLIVALGESGAKDIVGGGSQTGTGDQEIMGAVASSYNYLTWLTVYNSSSTNTFATLKDGSTTRAIIPLPAYGGAVLSWPRGIRSTVNTAWNVASGSGVTTAYYYGGGYRTTA